MNNFVYVPKKYLRWLIHIIPAYLLATFIAINCFSRLATGPFFTITAAIYSFILMLILVKTSAILHAAGGVVGMTASLLRLFHFLEMAVNSDYRLLAAAMERAIVTAFLIAYHLSMILLIRSGVLNGE